MWGASGLLLFEALFEILRPESAARLAACMLICDGSCMARFFFTNCTNTVDGHWCIVYGVMKGTPDWQVG